MKTKLLLESKNFVPSFKSWIVSGVLNPGGTRTKNNKIVLYARISEFAEHKHGEAIVCPMITSKNEYKISYQKIHDEDIIMKGKWNEIYLKDGTCRLPNISHFRKVILSKDGFNIDKIEQKPCFTGIPNESEYGVEDARITEIDGKYYMTYVGVSSINGVSTYLAISKDLDKWERIGLIFREQNKDVVLFPEKINGKYVALNRPESSFSFSRPGIWISYSKDLIYWGKEKNLARPRPGSWEENRIGAGCPPIKTAKGWILIYHGMRETASNNERVYSVGTILLDIKNPEKIIARTSTKKPLISPSNQFEKHGYINNVVFPTAAIKTLDKKSLLIYSGGADSVITARIIPINYILKNMEYN
ncbi:MAG: hypothetical protein QW727_02955 [Candidatus Pacearchaeota archaeon]